ncbi:hypothetical protein A7K94_0207120 [Modestobacter sp. VKM Ac-2676]|nr:hypothetical protein A7K94_0207120 [Modestobacter sp. VKM Ac-2676]
MAQRDRDLRGAPPGLLTEVAALLHRHDPIGIAFGDDSDEYSPEAGTIALRLPGARSVDDVRRIVHGEFVHWFDAGTAGPEETYGAIAEEIWLLLRR